MESAPEEVNSKSEAGTSDQAYDEGKSDRKSVRFSTVGDDPSESRDRHVSFKNFSAEIGDVRQQGAMLHRSMQIPAAEGEGDDEEDEDFDPYYGLGAGPRAPEPPLGLVFRLMETGRFQQIKRKKQKTIKLLNAVWYMVGFVILVALIFCFALFVYHCQEPPKLPKITVQETSIHWSHVYRVPAEMILQQQQEGKGNYFAFYINSGLNCVFKIKNLNRYHPIHFDWLELTIYFRGYPLGYDRIEDLDLPASGQIMPYFLAYILSVPLPLNVGETIKPHLLSDNYEFVTELIMRATMPMMNMKPRAFYLRVRCLHLLRNWEFLADCEYKNPKWRANNHGFKLFRKPHWPKEWNASFLLTNPREYYYPEYNYYLTYSGKNVGTYYPGY